MKQRLSLCFGLIASCLLCSPCRSDAVLDWDALMIDAIHLDTTSPTLSSRNLAILHAAIYDSVNSVAQSHQPYLVQLPLSGETSAEAAAVGAAYEVMQALYPSFGARIQDLFDTWFASAPETASITNGLALGQEVAALVIQDRAADGASTDIPYIPSNAPGQWQRTPPFFRPPLTPQWRYVRPFCLPENLELFVPAPPPPLESAEYAESFNQVKALGGKESASRTAEQMQIAVFWSDFSYTAMPPGHWHEIAATIAADKHTSLEENARLFALLSMAQADAGIVCWEAKFRFNLWRPITAIRRAGEDNNPQTEPDVAWDHLLAAPPFPSYTSGHSTFSKASGEVLTHFFGTDAITFSARSDSLAGVIRQFDSVSACVDEVGMSRIYGGIHFMFDNVAGKQSGKLIGQYVNRNFLLPNSALPALAIERFGSNRPILRIHGHVGRTCVLEASSDLLEWRSISTNTITVGGSSVTDRSAPLDSARFYRVREH